jgi:hypothetical protein
MGLTPQYTPYDANTGCCGIRDHRTLMRTPALRPLGLAVEGDRTMWTPDERDRGLPGDKAPHSPVATTNSAAIPHTRHPVRNAENPSPGKEPPTRIAMLRGDSPSPSARTRREREIPAHISLHCSPRRPTK